VTASAVLYANCSIAANADTRVKGFADVCYKDDKGVVEGVVSEGIVLKGIVLKGVLCCKDKEGEQRREEVITSLIKVKLRRL
jgi:hypothetical protein